MLNAPALGAAARSANASVAASVVFVCIVPPLLGE
jgi:hypothetical protein